MFSSNASQVSNDVKYIEDVCSVYLRTGTGSSQTVTTGIKENTGALVISKSRSAATDWAWYDTFRGATYDLVSNSTAAQTTQSQGLTSFNADGHTWGTLAKVNTNGATYVDTVLKPTPKFFDVVTWSGDDAANRQISHSLGSVPGCIIVKRTDASATWRVWHQNMVSNSANLYLNQLNLNTTNAVNLTYGEVWGTSNNVTSTTFQVGSLAAVNATGGTYVAYLFAHNAGGFGLTGTDNVISCGSFTTDGSGNATVDLGYEPQWILLRSISNAQNWIIGDVMRGWTATSTANMEKGLRANSSGAENGYLDTVAQVTATGFNATSINASDTYIYIAIRRGPMKVPTDATKVYNTILQTPQSTGTLRTVGFPADLVIGTYRSAATGRLENSRLTGFANNSGSSQDTPGMFTNATTAEANNYPLFYNVWNTTARDGDYIFGANGVNWAFGRAPGFFDEVCFTQSDYTQAYTHNLTVVPEMMIVKRRNNTSDWSVYSAALGNTKYLKLQDTGGEFTGGVWGNTNPTSTQFTFSGAGSPNTYVAYLFATCPGVSKVGSYTGTGTTAQINCGFTTGARFVLIKRTDSTGDWYVWDSARGIVAGNDPYLLLNSTAAEVTNTDYVDTYSAGFELSSTAPAAINASGGTFIFLAIA